MVHSTFRGHGGLRWVLLRGGVHLGEELRSELDGRHGQGHLMAVPEEHLQQVDIVQLTVAAEAAATDEAGNVPRQRVATATGIGVP